jgi:hypothetical protein
VNFGTATIATPKKRKSPPVKRYDCGKHGQLTAKEIAARAGIAVETVYDRVRRKWPAADLAEPAHALRREKAGIPRMPCVIMALRIARAFPNRVPTVRELRAVAPMCAVQARRWQRALEEVSAA